jgi:hypothetical protein
VKSVLFQAGVLALAFKKAAQIMGAKQNVNLFSGR